MESPWSVEWVENAIPPQILQQQQQHHHNDTATSPIVVASAVAGRWHVVCCCCCRHKGSNMNNDHKNNSREYYQLYVWYGTGGTTGSSASTNGGGGTTTTTPNTHHHSTTTTATSSTMRKQVPAVAVAMTLQHECLYTDPITVDCDTTTTPTIAWEDSPPNNRNNPPFLAMASPREEDVYIYVVPANTTTLLLWKVSHHELLREMQYTTNHTNKKWKAAIRMDVLVPTSNSMEKDDSIKTTKKNYITSLMVHWTTSHSPMILIGTSMGQILLGTQNHVPLGLRFLPPILASPTTSILDRLLHTVQYQSPKHIPIATAQRLTQTSFYTLSVTGQLMVWNKASHMTRFQCSMHQSILILWMEYSKTIQDQSLKKDTENGKNYNTDTMLQWQTLSLPHSCTVQTATVVESQRRIHVILFMEYPDQDERLYWITLQITDTEIQLLAATWLNRFADPHHISIVGLTVSSNDTVYAAFQQNPTASCIVMSCRDSSNTIVEVDLPTPFIQGLLVGSMVADTTTHGVTAMERTGMGLRLRYIEPEQVSTVPSHNHYTEANHLYHTVQKLTKHLLSEFWNAYHQPDRPIQLPPSLQTASLSDLEAAVMAGAEHLRDKHDQQQNPRQWHLAYMDWLIQTGLYRNLTSFCKWKLLSIGQQVDIFVALSNVRAESVWQKEQLETLTAANVGEWLCQVQENVHEIGSGDARHEMWTLWLYLVLSKAMKYREDHLHPTYDLGKLLPRASTITEIPVWTSSKHIRQVLTKQLAFWRSMGTVGATTEDMVESIIQSSIQTCSDAYASCTNSETKQAYVDAQSAAMNILRSSRGLVADTFLFGLFQHHCYFSGLCQIALEHERRKDHDHFDLVPLFDELMNEKDIETNLSFSRFVLKWHWNRNLYGHVLEFGKLCPDDLSPLVRTDASKSLRWIYDLRQGEYDRCAESLVAHANATDSTIHDARIANRLAFIANEIAHLESTNDIVQRRRCLIDNKADLIYAQQKLLGTNCAPSDTPWEPQQLLQYALEHTDQFDDKVEALEIALSVCACIRDEYEAQECAQTVWLQAIMLDDHRWKAWLQNEDDLSSWTLCTDVLQQTVFGGLLQICKDLENCPHVQFITYLDDTTILHHLSDRYPLLKNEGMLRLMRSVIHKNFDNTTAMVVVET